MYKKVSIVEELREGRISAEEVTQDLYNDLKSNVGKDINNFDIQYSGKGAYMKINIRARNGERMVIAVVRDGFVARTGNNESRECLTPIEALSEFM